MDLPFDRTKRRRIYLMRHAEAAYIAPDGTRAPDSRVVALTERGREEATAMAALMAEIPFDRVVVSGLQRTLETASIVLGPRTVKIEAVNDLEEIRGGDPVARAKLSPPDYAYAMFQAAEPGQCFAAGEAFAKFTERVLPAYYAMAADPDWATLLMVCHGGVNRAILTDITCGGLKAFGAFEQDSCCVNIIDVDTCRDAGTVQRQILRGVNITAGDPLKETRRLLTMEGLAKSFAEAAKAKIV
jgi:probable phosphoglycerate mutase